MIIVLPKSAQDLPVLYSAMPFLYKTVAMGFSRPGKNKLLMTPQKRKELEDRRTFLQQRLQATAFAEGSIVPFVEILQILKESHVQFGIVEFVNVRREWKIFLDEILSGSPFAAFGLNKVPRSNDNALINALLDRYPSTNPFRYVPGLPLMPYDTSLSSIIETYDAGREIVYFNYFAYPFVLELPLSHLKQVNETELFNSRHEDAVIFPKNKEWLIAYSLEEEWRHGKKK